MEIKFNFVRCLMIGVVGGLLVLGGGCGGLIKVGTAKDATPPVVRFTTRPEFGVVPLAVSFDASATNDSESLISSYSWDFDGDGKEDSMAPVATFTYQQPGVYYPRLKVVNNEGLTSYSTGNEIIANDKVYIRIETDKEVYKTGEDVKINLILVNEGEGDYLYRPPYDEPSILISNSLGEALWKYVEVSIGAIVLEPIKVPIQNELKFTGYTWSQNYGTSPNRLDVFSPPEMIKTFFSEYTGDIRKLQGEDQVGTGKYIIKATIKKVWGRNRINITN